MNDHSYASQTKTLDILNQFFHREGGGRKEERRKGGAEGRRDTDGHPWDTSRRTRTARKMGDRELLQWVSDKLHDVLGFSESSTAQFVVALARRASKSGKGASALLAGLADLDVPANATSRAFAGELMARYVGCQLRGGVRVVGPAAAASFRLIPAICV